MKKRNIIIMVSIILIILIIILGSVTIKIDRVKEEKGKTVDIALYNNMEKNDNMDKDKYIIQDFINKKNELEEYLHNYKIESLKEKGSSYYVLLSNFLFYNGKINDISIHDVKDETKDKLLIIYNNIDSLILEKVPDYKDNLDKQYTNIKDYLCDSYNDTINNIINTIGIEKYNNLIKSKEEVTSEAKSVYEKAKEKIVTWTEE